MQISSFIDVHRTRSVFIGRIIMIHNKIHLIIYTKRKRKRKKKENRKKSRKFNFKLKSIEERTKFFCFFFSFFSYHCARVRGVKWNSGNRRISEKRTSTKAMSVLWESTFAQTASRAACLSIIDIIYFI